jgi:hypothetical protein
MQKFCPANSFVVQLAREHKVGNPGTKTWEDTFAILSNHVREAFHRNFPLFKEDEVPPQLVALRDAFYAFPVPTDVLLIDSGKVQPVEPRLYLDTKNEEGPIWTLIANHVAQAPARGITFHGTRLLAELDTYSSLLKERFGFRDDDGSLEIIRDLKSTGFWDYGSLDIVDFIPFDIRERPEAYGTLFAQSHGQFGDVDSQI